MLFVFILLFLALTSALRTTPLRPDELTATFTTILPAPASPGTFASNTKFELISNVTASIAKIDFTLVTANSRNTVTNLAFTPSDTNTFPSTSYDLSSIATDVLIIAKIIFSTTPPTFCSLNLLVKNGDDTVEYLTQDWVTELTEPLFTVTNPSDTRPTSAYNNIIYVTPTTYSSVDKTSYSDLGIYWKNTLPTTEFPTKFDVVLHNSATFVTTRSSSSSIPSHCTVNSVTAEITVDVPLKTLTITVPTTLYIGKTHFVNIRCATATGYGVKYVSNSNPSNESITVYGISPSANVAPTTVTAALTDAQLIAASPQAIPNLQFMIGQTRLKQPDWMTCAYSLSFNAMRGYKMPIEMHTNIGGISLKSNVSSVPFSKFPYHVISYEGDFISQTLNDRVSQQNHIVPVNFATGETPPVITLNGFDATAKVGSDQEYGTNSPLPFHVMTDLRPFDMENNFLQCSVLIKSYSTQIPATGKVDGIPYTFTLITNTFQIFYVGAPGYDATNGGLTAKLSTYTPDKNKKSYRRRYYNSIDMSNPRGQLINRIDLYLPHWQGRMRAGGYTLDNLGMVNRNQQFSPTKWIGNYASFKVEDIANGTDHIDPLLTSFRIRSSRVRYFENFGLLRQTETKNSKYLKLMYTYDWRSSMKSYYTGTPEFIAQYELPLKQQALSTLQTEEDFYEDDPSSHVPESSYFKQLVNTLDNYLENDGQLADYFYPQDDEVEMFTSDDNDDSIFSPQQSGNIIRALPKKSRSVKSILGGQYFQHNAFSYVVAYQGDNEVVGIFEKRSSWDTLRGWRLAITIALPIIAFVGLITGIIIFALVKS